MMGRRLPVASELPAQVGVLVLGGGLAGCSAMLAAAEAGRFAVLLEKEDQIGGSTVRSSGLSAFAGTDEQEAQGIGDSVELLRKDLLETGLYRNDEALVDLYCEHQLDTYRWLKAHGIRYGEVHAASGQSIPRSHPTDSTGMLTTLLNQAGQLGGRILTGVPATRLVRENGRVIGVEVTTDGQRRTVRADAVVIATGGFSRSTELLDRFAPQMHHALRAGGEGCHGDGLLMAWQMGAGLRDLPYVKGTYGIYPHPHPGEDGTGILAVYKGAIAVNLEGRRFIDESLPYKVIGDANLAQPQATTFQIFDAGVMAQSNDEVPIYDFAGRDRAGLLVAADSIPALAEKLGLPPEELDRTVANYNQRIADEVPDEYGRKHLSGTFGQRRQLIEPPYYAHRSGTVVLATYCGLTVDTTMRVLDVFGHPIEGLYAAGEVTGGFHGAGYVTGTSIGKAAIFGRVAGTSAAQVDSAMTW